MNINAQAGYSILYFEINVFSVILLLMVGARSRGLSRMVAQRNFIIAIISEIAFILSDTVYVMITRGVLPFSITAALACKEIYFLSTALMCFFWFIYFECLQNTYFIRRKKLVLLSSSLVWLTAAMLVINLFNGIFFYFDGNGGYHRGPLFILQYVFAYIYIVVACARLLLNIKNKGTPDWEELRPLAAYPILPAIAGILQYIYPQLPLACITMSGLTLALYLNWTNQLISLDPLTKLGNRKQFLHYYRNFTANEDNLHNLYLIVMDVDKFKGINDRFGHTEGDAALIRIADVLRDSFGSFPGRTNISRYGGDEFIALVSADNTEALDKLPDRINGSLEAANSKSGSPYRLRLSIGMTRVRPGVSIESLISEADEKMYLNKKENKTS